MFLQFPSIQITALQFILIIIVPIFIVAEIIALKIALKITKAEERTKLKMVAMSFLIQMGVMLFVASPLILIGFADPTGQDTTQGIDPGLIGVFVALALFIDINVINILHKLGYKRSLIVFGFLVIPAVLVVMFAMNIIGPAMEAASNMPEAFTS